MGRLLSIQYLRAVAVLMVVGYHACLFAWRTGFEIGAAGVDVFFVISGFIIWTVTAERETSPGRFFLRRLGRVAPLYWIVTLAVAAIAWKWPSLIFDANPTPKHLALSLAFISHMNPSGRPNPVLPVGWSLNDEALFYLLFALVMAAKPKNRLAALAWTLAGLVLVAIKIPHLYYLDYNAMFFQFLAGAWLGKLRQDNHLPTERTGWLLIVGAVVLFAILDPLDWYQTLARPFTWGAPAVMLVAGAITIERHRKLADIKPLIFLGDASYSIYLIHWPVISALSHAMNSGDLAYLPIAIIASIAAGCALHITVERPLLRLFHERLAGRTLPSGAS